MPPMVLDRVPVLLTVPKLVTVPSRRPRVQVVVPVSPRSAPPSSVPPRRINEIVHGKRAITADTALRLSRFFGSTARFWMNLQTAYDLDVESRRLKRRLEREVSVLKQAG